MPDFRQTFFAVGLGISSFVTVAPAEAGHPEPLTSVTETISHEGAQLAVQAALRSSRRLDAPCAVAVVDPSGTLVAFESSDGVRPGSPDLAIGKARTAALLQRPTAEVEDKTNNGRLAFVTAGFMTLRGGMPLHHGERVVGAIGVAGLNKDNDVKIATEAADAFASAAGFRTGDR